MIGTIIGDIVGSRFEWNNHRSKDFQLFTQDSFPTDDSIMSIAVAKAIMTSEPDHSDLADNAIYFMQKFGRKYPNSGYGRSFYDWIFSRYPRPYHSFGNGAAMRISSVGFSAKDLNDAKRMSKLVTGVTHNHPEGLKGAETIAVSIFLARTGKNKREIFEYVNKNYYLLDFSLDEIRDTYKFNETCQGTVPQALVAFFESNDFEDAIRNAISIGGDSDTIAAITGGIAEAYYGVPDELRQRAYSYLDRFLLNALLEFEEKYQC